MEFDQFDPPEDEVRPASEAVIGGEAVVVESPGRREVLLCDVEAIGISETLSEPRRGTSRPDPHRLHVESIYVLEGELAVMVGGRAEIRAEAGSWIQVPEGAPRTVSASGSEPARFLSLHTPGRGFGDSLRAR